MAGRRGKRWLVWLGAPLLLVALLVAFWSWDWFIPLAEARASAAIGRPVKIAAPACEARPGRHGHRGRRARRQPARLPGRPAFRGGGARHGAARCRRLPALAGGGASLRSSWTARW